MGNGHKYGAKKTTVDGITFDSKAEARRYGELKLLQQANQITCLELQPEFILQDKFVDSSGVKHSAIKYIGDFQYEEITNVSHSIGLIRNMGSMPHQNLGCSTPADKTTYFTIVVEDVKGVETPVWKLKKKLFLAKYPQVELRVIK